MSNREKLVAVGSESDSAENVGMPEMADSTAEELVLNDVVWEDEPAPRRFGWIVPSLAVLAIVGWTGFFGWVHQRELVAGITPAQGSEWIVAWSVPVLLVVSLWLLAMRTFAARSRALLRCRIGAVP